MAGTINVKLMCTAFANMTIAPIISLFYSWFKTHTFDFGYRTLRIMWVICFISPSHHCKIDSPQNHMSWSNISSLPWNQTTILGYFGEICFTVIASETYLIVTGVFLILFISICNHHQAFYDIFKQSINECNRHDEKFIRGLIQFHISTKRYPSHSRKKNDLTNSINDKYFYIYISS